MNLAGWVTTVQEGERSSEKESDSSSNSISNYKNFNLI